MIRTRKIILGVIIFVFLFFFVKEGLHWFLRPMRVVVVNYSDANWGVWKVAASFTPYTLHRLTFAELEERSLTNYDVILIWARGWHPTSKQKEQLDLARKRGTKVYTSATTLDESIGQMNVTEQQAKKINDYIEQGGIDNITSLLHYFAHEFQGYSVNVPDVVVRPNVGYFHLGDKFFETFEEYEQYLDSLQPMLKKDAPRVAILGPILRPYATLERQSLDELIDKLTRHGVRVYAINGLKEKPELLEKCQPDVAVVFPIGQILSGNEGKRILERLNIPCLIAINIIASREEWESEPTAMSGAYLSLSTVLPEMDGAIEPTAVSTVDLNEDGLKLRNPIHERIDRFVRRILRWSNLRRKSNAEKRVAIVYYKGPGHAAITAKGLETVKSLYNTLLRLKQEGYNLGDSFPSTLEEFQQRIDVEGRTVGQWAVGALEQFVKEGKPEMIPATQYSKWFQQEIPEKRQQEIISLWGNIPGKILTVQENEQSMILVSRIRFGNIVILPQPTTAILTDEEIAQGTHDTKSIHGTMKPPPHFYIAPYLWLQHGFKADILVHFGTHGSLEFTQGKSVALSEQCFPVILIGDLPHVYIYSINNIGEALLAKRRSAAVLVSYLTQPFTEAGMYGSLQTICEKITDIKTVEGDQLKLEIRRSITRLAEENDLLQEIDVKKTTHENTEFLLDDEQIEKLHDYLHQLEGENVNDGLHVLGRSWTEEQIVKTAVAMLGDRALNEIKLDDDISKDDHNYLDKKREKLLDLVRQSLLSPSSSLESSPIEETPPKEKPTRKPANVANSRRPQRGQSIPATVPVVNPLANIGKYIRALQESQNAELDRFIMSLSGKFIPPSSGGDVIINPDAAPTGRNIMSLDVESTPSEEAWTVAVRLSDEIIAEHQKQHNGAYPRRISCTFWGGEYIRTRGTILAQSLYFMGVRLVRDSRGSVVSLEVIPSEELKRPRIDIFIQTSGQFRDAAGSRIELLNQAVEMVSKLPDEPYQNFVKEHSLKTENILKRKGYSAAESREYSTARIFGSPYAANYGTGIMEVIERGDRWENDSQIADKYIKNMNGVFRNGKVWGIPIDGLMESQLDETDIILHSRSSNTWGPLRLDHVYEFSTLALAVRSKTGVDPQILFSDLRNPEKAKVTQAKKAIREETRTTLWNPKYISALQKESGNAAAQFVETIRNLYGWNVVQPSSIDASLWEETYRVYIEDKNKLGLREYFEKQSPYALQDITAIMLETIRKELWKASPEIIENLTKIHAEFVAEHGAGCSYDTCANSKLHQFIGNHLTEELQSKYQNSLNTALQSTQPLPEIEGIELEKKTTKIADEQEQKDFSFGIILAIFLTTTVILTMGIFIGRRGKLHV